MRAANFGINGDRIQHVLWRLQNGEGTGFSPKLVVLLLGTNGTTPRNTTAEVIAGLAAVVTELKKDFPRRRSSCLASCHAERKMIEAGSDRGNQPCFGWMGRTGATPISRHREASFLMPTAKFPWT